MIIRKYSSKYTSIAEFILNSVRCFPSWESLLEQYLRELNAGTSCRTDSTREAKHRHGVGVTEQQLCMLPRTASARQTQGSTIAQGSWCNHCSKVTSKPPTAPQQGGWQGYTGENSKWERVEYAARLMSRSGCTHPGCILGSGISFGLPLSFISGQQLPSHLLPLFFLSITFMLSTSGQQIPAWTARHTFLSQHCSIPTLHAQIHPLTDRRQKPFHRHSPHPTQQLSPPRVLSST